MKSESRLSDEMLPGRAFSLEASKKLNRDKSFPKLNPLAMDVRPD